MEGATFGSSGCESHLFSLSSPFFLSTFCSNLEVERKETNVACAKQERVFPNFISLFGAFSGERATIRSTALGLSVSKDVGRASGSGPPEVEPGPRRPPLISIFLFRQMAAYSALFPRAW